MYVKAGKDFGKFVKVLRLGRHIRQEDVAARAGVSRQWMVALEKGKPGVGLDLVLRTYEAIGLEINVTPLDPPPAWTLQMKAEGEMREMRMTSERNRRRRARRARDREAREMAKGEGGGAEQPSPAEG